MENGIILLDKESGFTSRDVDNLVSKQLGIKKVGHLGTLDPFATGLLVVAVNKGTKFLPFLDDSEKSYLASLRLGISSSTGDPTGIRTASLDPVPSLSDLDIRKVMDTFLGDSEQIPPMTSAIKINGEELYKKAHRGEVVERKPRKIHIYSLNLIKYEDHVLVFSTTVSQGTYIRTLGEDIAKKLGTVGYLESLRRLSVGNFMIKDAKKLANLSLNDVFDPTIFLTSMKHVEIDANDENKVKNGVPMELLDDYGERVLLVLHGVPLAVYQRKEKHLYLSLRGLF
jgi:tRNA pseudouridine55 synthase